MLVGVHIERFHPGDVEALTAYVEVENAVRAADTPWQHPLTVRQAAGSLEYGWDLEPGVPLLGRADGPDGEAVAIGELSVSEYDNLHLAWLDVGVHPDHRRRGHGTAMLAELAARAGALGRTTITVDSWDAEGHRAFAARHGLTVKSAGVSRRQVLAELDWDGLDQLRDDALSAAADYELERRLPPTPDEELDEMAAMAAAINDAPTDDLDVEDDVIDARRLRAYETAMQRRGIALHRVVARHRDSGELAGHTVVGVEDERPHLGAQHDTSVVAAHRGHRLGTLLKVEMLRWLREAQPQLGSVDTWNAESNDFMIGVNEALGYRALGRWLTYQGKLG